MKKLLQISIFPLSLMAALPSFAYMQCPAGVDPNGPNNTGVACYWVDPDEGDAGGENGQSERRPDLPDFYMAVVGHPNTPYLWSSTGYLNVQDAEQAALDGCMRMMKSGCQTLLRTHNSQYVGIVRDKAGVPYVSSNSSIATASDAAMRRCKEHAESCRESGMIYNTMMQTDNFPSEPVKRYPSRP